MRKELSRTAICVKLNSMPIFEKKHSKALINVCFAWYTLNGLRYQSESIQLNNRHTMRNKRMRLCFKWHTDCKFVKERIVFPSADNLPYGRKRILRKRKCFFLAVNKFFLRRWSCALFSAAVHSPIRRLCQRRHRALPGRQTVRSQRNWLVTDIKSSCNFLIYKVLCKEQGQIVPVLITKRLSDIYWMNWDTIEK